MMSVNQNEFITSSVVEFILVLVVNNVARSLSVGYQILMPRQIAFAHMRYSGLKIYSLNLSHSAIYEE